MCHVAVFFQKRSDTPMMTINQDYNVTQKSIIYHCIQLLRLCVCGRGNVAVLQLMSDAIHS